MDKPRGCSEFCTRWRELILDGKVVDLRDMWKKCGDNPLYPQGGTWIFDRAYWCPGDLQQPDVIDLFTKPGRHTAVLRMEPYTAADIHGNCLIVIKSETFPIVFLEVFEHDKK